MSKRLVFPAHILYDSRVIDASLLLDSLQQMAENLQVDSDSPTETRLGIIQIGACMGKLSSLEALQAKELDPSDYRLDLKSALEGVLQDYQHFDRSGQGFGNPEILLLLGSPSLEDWKATLELILPYRSLILTYWVGENPTAPYEKDELDRFLNKISPPDPESKTPRYKIVDLATTEPAEFLKDAFTKLGKRLCERSRFYRPITTGQITSTH